ncbi:MAG: lipopolysaccharide biosynthesis protein [Roseiflexaceae bacterium]
MARLFILRLFDSYFRHRWLNLLPLVLMLAMAGAYFQLAEPQYVSRGRLYVQKSSLLPSLTQIRVDGISYQSPTQIAVSEVNELVLTEAFIRSVIQKTDLEASMADGPDAVQKIIDRLRTELSVTAVGDSIIEITVKNNDPKLAQQLAAAVIESYSLWKLNGDRQESAVAQAFFAGVIPGYQEDLQKVRDQLETFLKQHPVQLRGERPAEEQVEIDRLQSAVASSAKRVENALEKEESARLSQTQAESSVRQDYLLIDAPTVPTKPETSLKERVTGPAIFAIIGLLLTLGGIIGGALLDRSFRFPLDVHSNLNLPVLALVPDVSRTVQPAVINEPTQVANNWQDRNGFDSTPIAQLSYKQRRARQQLPAGGQSISTLDDIADNSRLPDQTSAST